MKRVLHFFRSRYFALFVALTVIFGPLLHFVNQNGKFFYDPEMMGFCLRKGGYRSWYVSVSQGRAWVGMWTCASWRGRGTQIRFRG
jgi:hypothetical protein